MCGGTLRGLRFGTLATGLSPRVRGNPAVRPWRLSRPGSIPACAGEPPIAGGWGGTSGVYPRVCGGTLFRGPRQPLDPGLSPRVRGNPRDVATGAQKGRSIPACAGEPATSRRWRATTWVYPRVCGGTYRLGLDSSGDLGLSPRVRGNHVDLAGAEDDVGSIPACAGEPTSPRIRPTRRWVYPRVCGGTGGASSFQSMDMGLSPRVRGNRGPRAPRCGRGGSIPACAGEPAEVGVVDDH